MHGLAAARLGRSEMALDFFRQASAIDLADTHAALDGGVHIAALGGVWMVAVLGFAGLSMHPNGLALRPQLPKGWTSLAFAVQWRGRSVRIAIDQGEGALRATLESSAPMTLVIGIGGEFAHWMRRPGEPATGTNPAHPIKREQNRRVNRTISLLKTTVSVVRLLPLSTILTERCADACEAGHPAEVAVGPPNLCLRTSTSSRYDHARAPGSDATGHRKTHDDDFARGSRPE